MALDNLSRARAQLDSAGLDGILISDPATLTWLTGHVPFDVSGPNPFAGGPALGYCSTDHLALLTSGAGQTATVTEDLAHWHYLGYTVNEPMDPSGYLQERFTAFVETFLPAQGTLGIERSALPLALADTLEKIRPSLHLQPADDLFLPLRAVKTAPEVEKIRAAAQLCDLAQRTLIQLARPGITELELFSTIYGKLIPYAGGAYPMTTGLVGGLRTGKRLPGPANYRLQPNDPVLFDIALNLGGYWGDNCNTIVLGEPSAPFQKLHAVVFDALTFAKTLIAPGIRASDVDARVRSFIRERGHEPYSHHTGHGIGVSYHEAPRLVPYNHAKLQAGNVLCLEPGIYDPDIGGVRLEDIVLVTANGCEVLSQGGRPLSK